MNDNPLVVLSNVLKGTQSPDDGVRKQAEQRLQQFPQQAGYAGLLIRFIEANCVDTSPDAKTLRTLGAVVFKNLIKKSWVPVDDGEAVAPALGEADKDHIKAAIVHIMCVAPPEVQRQFSEALNIISGHDFPEKWQTLLPDLVQRMQTEDYHVLNGILLTANAILKRFRYVFKTDDLYRQLQYVLDNFAAPLLQVFLRTSGAVVAAQGNQQQLELIFEALRLMARVFFSLNWQDLPEFFEDNMGPWMTEFLKYLTYENPQLQDPQGQAAGPVEKLQAAIVENVNLYASKYEDEFGDYLQNFTAAVWGLLMKVDPQPKNDMLATTCIRFLNAIVSHHHNRKIFETPGILRQIVENIVVPNLKLRTIDEELFEDNAMDYIQRDMEGSDSDTRRRCSCDLVRGMCKHFEEDTTSICLEFIEKMLQEYSSNPAANWRAKDAAIQLLLALTVRAQSQQGGVSQTNRFIEVMTVFRTHILPEVTEANVDARPIVKADCLKFITTFRNQCTVEDMRGLMPLLIKHLGAESDVVKTYAAMAVERMLVVKDKRQGGPPSQRFGKQELSGVLAPLFTSLFRVLDESGEENEYVMKAIMRCLSTAQETVRPVVPQVLGKLTEYLGKACANPSNPLFNHYLFESLAALVAKVCQADRSAVDQFETALFPPFQQVLAQDVTEFTPYVFQILAQLLHLRPGLSPGYMSLYPPLVTPSLWERKSNIPALTKLVQAYLYTDAATLVQQHPLGPVLGVFQKLLSSKANEMYAFQLLETIVTKVPVAQLQPFFKDLFQLLLMRLQLQQARSPAFVRRLTLFFSVFTAVHGAQALQQGLDNVQPGMLTMILQQVWLPALQAGLSLDRHEQRVYTLGMTCLLTDASQVQVAPLWGNTLAALMNVIAPPDSGVNVVTDDAEQAEDVEDVQYDSTFSQLHFASSERPDTLSSMPDDRQFLAQSLGTLSRSQPGRYGPMVQTLPPEQLEVLQRYFTKYGATLA